MLDAHFRERRSSVVLFGDRLDVLGRTGLDFVAMPQKLTHQSGYLVSVLVNESKGPMASCDANLFSERALIGDNHWDSSNHQIQ